ncbi:hypothetical protein C8R43DRAFT_964333 [Mycena crocata]|nr:hypothetical protein C8R43DRAFT_964333 [Mycena crocata]
MASQTKNLAKVHGYRGRTISKVNSCMDIEGEPVHGYRRRTRAWISKANPCMDIEGEPVHGYRGRTRAWISRANPCMDIEGEPVHGYRGRTRAWISKANPCMHIEGEPVHAYRGRTRAWISRANPCMDIEGEPVHGYRGRTRAWISKANPCMDIEGEPVHEYRGRTRAWIKWPPEDPAGGTKWAPYGPQKSEIGLRERSMDESTPGPVDESRTDPAGYKFTSGLVHGARQRSLNRTRTIASCGSGFDSLRPHVILLVSWTASQLDAQKLQANRKQLHGVQGPSLPLSL